MPNEPFQRTQPGLSRPLRPSRRAAPFLFLVLEAGRPTGGSARFAIGDVDEVLVGRGDVRAAERTIVAGARRLEVRVPDPWMSRAHARIARVGGELVIVDRGSSNGSLVDGVRVDTAPLHDGTLVELGHTIFSVRILSCDDKPPDVLDASDGEPALATVLPALEAGFAALERLAASSVSIVLRGPSGSGKELVADVVHRRSRRSGACVAVNCGAIPDELVASELFGHRRGAFSGAVADKVGLVAAADRGTLFLDEIGDLPLAVQPALLRVLEEHAVQPVGAVTSVPVEFRVVAATHRDLEAMVARGDFREDLWARLNGFTFELPPLADRREDLGTMVTALLERLEPEREVTLTPDAARAIVRYAWPRNVRELAKVLEAAVALANGRSLDLEHLPPALTRGTQRSGVLQLPDDVVEPAPRLEDAGAREQDPRAVALAAALREHGGNVSAAARALGKPRSQIQRWMRRWGLRGADG